MQYAHIAGGCGDDPRRRLQYLVVSCFLFPSVLFRNNSTIRNKSGMYLNASGVFLAPILIVKLVKKLDKQ